MITLKKNRPRNVTVVLASVIIMACVLGCTDEKVSTSRVPLVPVVGLVVG